MARYKVKATMNGKRITTSISWNTKAEAQKYADETKKYYRTSNPRVVKVK